MMTSLCHDTLQWLPSSLLRKAKAHVDGYPTILELIPLRALLIILYLEASPSDIHLTKSLTSLKFLLKLPSFNETFQEHSL